MNKPIRRVAVVAMLMVGLLLGNVTWSTIVRAPGLLQDARNRRVTDARFAQDRGAILAGGTEIAVSRPVDDQYKFQRSYPQGEKYASVTGAFSFYGPSGLESSYNAQLSGTSDSLLLRNAVDVITGAAPRGASVETTINPKLQDAAWKALGSHEGAVVASDPRTGRILALVSKPSWDPNQLATHDLAQLNRNDKALQSSSQRPLESRATRQNPPPGSTFKLVTAAAALENGARPDTQYDAPRKLKVSSSYTLPNEGGASCGGDKVTLAKALEVSCNTAFANAGLQLGQDKLAAQAQKFGFGGSDGCDRCLRLRDLNGAASSFPTKSVDRDTLARSAIGQDSVTATPLEINTVTAAIANGGMVMQPQIVENVRSASLQVVEKHTPKEYGRAMSEDNARALTSMMVGVVDNGTGRPAQINGVKVAGKTGTAQTSKDANPLAWFTAFAPADHPKIAVTVMVRDPSGERSDISGGRLAAPVATSVMRAAL